MMVSKNDDNDLPQSEPEIGVDLEEDTGGGGEDVKPWDASKIRITTKNFSLREIASQISEHELDLSPDFQRAYVWKEKQRTRLVESILLGIPLPAFYFNQERDGAYQVVDGVQRLSTIRVFMADEEPLVAAHLEYRKDLADKRYSELDASLRRRFASTQIVVHIIEPQTPDEVKYDIFSRVNTLGSPLSAQEIRHAMSKPKSRGLLLDLSMLDEFDRATGGYFWSRDSDGQWVRDNRRMTDRELVLRFCAFRHATLDEYRMFESLDSFLLDFTRRLDGRAARGGGPIPDTEIVSMKHAFSLAMKNAAQILGKAAFRRPVGANSRGPINRAIFESQALALAGTPTDALIAQQERVGAAFRELFNDATYVRAVTVGTGNVEQVRIRLEKTRLALAGAMP